MNLAIISIVLKDFVAPFINELEEYGTTPRDKFDMVMNAASDANEEEVVQLLEYVEKQDLIKTFFPE